MLEMGQGSTLFGAGALSSRAAASNGPFYGGNVGGFGDFNVQFGGVGGSGSLPGVSLPLLIVGGVVAVLWLKKKHSA